MENFNEKTEKSEEKRKETSSFLSALNDAISSKFDKMAAESEDIEFPEPSREYKLKMNRLFREATNGSFIPYPEVDE